MKLSTKTSNGIDGVQKSLSHPKYGLDGIQKSILVANSGVEGIKESLINTNQGFNDIQKSFATIDQSIRDFAGPAFRVKIQGSCHVIPYGRNERFFGRKDILAQMETELLDMPQEARRMRSFALHGMPGVGKTQTALQFVHQHLSAFEAIFWVSASSTEKLSQEYVDIARALDLDKGLVAADQLKSANLVKDWLRYTGRVSSLVCCTSC